MVVVTSPAGGLRTTQTYDATGLRRKSETVGATTNFIWDGQNVLLETDRAAQTQAVYTYRPQTYGDLISQRRAAVSHFHHYDALGSTTELTNVAAAVTDTYRYYAFGETCFSTGGSDDPFGFVGRLGYYNEPTLALQYLGARWYEPSTARFFARDKAAPSTDEVLGLNRYAYVLNGPTAYVDPNGRNRYDFCKGYEGAALKACKWFVDFMCKRHPTSCCEADRVNCYLDCSNKCEDDKEYELCIFKCDYDYLRCMMKGG